MSNRTQVVVGINHQRASFFKTIKGSAPRRHPSLCGRHKELSPGNDKLSPLSSYRLREGGTYDMGICPVQAPIAIGPFCLLCKSCPVRRGWSSPKETSPALSSLLLLTIASISLCLRNHRLVSL